MLGHEQLAGAVGLGEVDREAEVDVLGLRRTRRLAVDLGEGVVHLRHRVDSAWTTAQPIRWVKDTLPPRPRARWLLITMRLSMSSLAGTARTLVAVGTGEAGLHVGDDAGGGAAQR